MDITISELTQLSIGTAIRQLEYYARTMERKVQRLCSRLASLGAWEATIGFSQAIYDGEKVFDVRVDEKDDGYYIVANGETVLFLEFGAGVRYGYGHPQAAEFGMGPGTYPGKGHWNNPHGWWFTDDMGKHHSYGNAPAMPMYNTAQDIRSRIEEVAREVFAND